MISSFINTGQNIARLIKIARILAHHDALFSLRDLGVAPIIVLCARLISHQKAPGRPGERLARALNEAGPSFIKLGQSLSTRSDILGEEMSEDLAQLQDSLPPFSGAEARKYVEAEFGVPITELFSEFDEKAIAAASIAQVHFATTIDGRDVAVKILRPGIEEAFQKDLKLFRWLAKLFERARPDLKRMKPLETVETLAGTVELEMDLRFEAAAAAELAENFEGDENFMVPSVDWLRTGRRVLTTQRIMGIPMDDRAAIIEAGHDPLVILEKAANITFRQILYDGYFHADVHPGNLFVLENGSIGAVDFGIMGRLDMKTRRSLGELLLAFLNRDYRRAAKVHFEADWIPQNQSLDQFTQACRSIAEPILDLPQDQISIARLLGQLFEITETFQMEAQPQLLLLQKTLLVAEGTSRKLDPGANMWVMARPLIEEWMYANLGPEAKIKEAVHSLTDTVSRLPGILNNLEKLGQTGISIDSDTIERLRGHRSFGGDAISSSTWLIVTTMIVIAAILKWG